MCSVKKDALRNFAKFTGHLRINQAIFYSGFFGAFIKFYFDPQVQISLLEDLSLFWLQQMFNFSELPKVDIAYDQNSSLVLTVHKVYSFKVNTDILGFSHIFPP